MKVVYLILTLISGEESYILHKIKFETILTCDEIFDAVIKYKDIGDRTYPTYKNKVVFAHYCLDVVGDYYLGTEYE